MSALQNKLPINTNKLGVSREDFLAFILPELIEGETYCAVSIKAGKVNQSFHNTIKGISDSSDDALIWEKDSYYSMATYSIPSKGMPNRLKVSVRRFKSLWIDLDIGDGTTFPTQEDGISALKEFIKATGLPKPTLVSSGFGLHVYFSVKQAIGFNEWEPLAEALKARILSEGFKVKDAGITTDAVRILRLPETVNYKKGIKTDVKLLCLGESLELAEYQELLLVGSEGNEQSSFLDGISKMPVKNPLNETTLVLMGINELPNDFPCNEANKDRLRKAVGELYQREKIECSETEKNPKDGYTLPNQDYYKVVCAFKSLTTMVGWTHEEAFNLYDEVCMQMGGYDAANNLERWTKHSSCPGKPITYKSLLNEIKAEPKAPIIQTIPLDDETSITLETMKSGRYRPSLNNLVEALKTPEFSSIQLGYDTFKDKLMYAVAGDTQWKPLTDAAYTELRFILHNKGFEEIPAKLMIEAIKFVAGNNRFDSAIEWLNDRESNWDGIKRVESFCSKYFGVADSAYTMSVSQYMWTGMAARVFDAGCQLDMTPVFVGDQGDGKSTGIMALVPETDMATEISFLEDEDKTTRKMRGILVAEISELKGINTRDAESIKAFLSRTKDRIKPLYAEFTVDISRRCIFIGTTNNQGFLGDETGERRWLPMVSGKVDREAIKRDRDQLWAEAAYLYKKHGIMWDKAQHLAKAEHCNFKEEDLWLPDVEAYLKGLQISNGITYTTIAGDSYLTTSGILYGALSIEVKNQQRRDEMRIGKIMIALGYKKKKLRLNGTAQKNYWVKS
jgi:hypothetical protein